MYGNRRSIRLKDYDYTQEGGYYVTVCVQDRKCVLGDVCGQKVELNERGKIVETAWSDLAKHNDHVVLDQFIIMPDHIHGILFIVGAGSQPALKNNRSGLEPAPARHGLSEIVRQFKTFSARRINRIENISGVRFWQRGYYDHVIRNERDLSRIREYIMNNPMDWKADEYYGERIDALPLALKPSCLITI